MRSKKMCIEIEDITLHSRCAESFCFNLSMSSGQKKKKKPEIERKIYHIYIIYEAQISTHPSIHSPNHLSSLG